MEKLKTSDERRLYMLLQPLAKLNLNDELEDIYVNEFLAKMRENNWNNKFFSSDMGYARYFRDYGAAFWCENDDSKSKNGKTRDLSDKPEAKKFVRFAESEIKPIELLQTALLEDIDQLLEANWNNP